MRPLASALVLAALLSACASGPDPDMPPIAGTSWKLATVDGQPALAGAEVTMQFADDKLAGNTGINRFSGPWTWSGGVFDAGPLAMTRAAGAPAVMEQEHRVIAALDTADHVRLDGDRLILGIGARDVLVFDRQR